MKTFKLVNNLTGWLIFAVAAFTYCSTIEPTASFWDCPEFITTASKMEVGHPPGAPFFMLFGKFFTLFASDTTQIARMVNMMSALLSAGCILLLFWSITHLVRKMIVDDNAQGIGLGKTITIMASGVAGALIYAWSDTFWFSAVEGEVYAFSSFFTALVFWLILKWEDAADHPHSDRWIVLIAYLVGLSIGVHLLNLLCIPAIVLVYYYKRAKEPNLKGSLAVLGVSVAIVAAVLYGIVPGIVKVGGWFELLFVNGLGMSFNTGLYIYIALLLAVLSWALWETQRQQKANNRMRLAFLISTAMLGIPFYDHGMTSILIGLVVLAVIAVLLWQFRQASARILNTMLLCMALITVGYSSYAVIVIRSTANPPMDQNSPEDVFTLGEYLGREQYGDRPLFFGPTYASQPEIIENANGEWVYKNSEKAPIYQQRQKKSADEKDEYIIASHKFEYDYPFSQCMLFPRIYSSNHAGLYQQWLGGVTSKTVTPVLPDGRPMNPIEIPSWWDNMRYFFSYQMGFMYWRYFMWNFAGRQNDIQGAGELEHGNWITGIPLIDNALYGDQSLLPSDLKANKGHNVFYCLPLILGLIGFCWQAFNRKKRGIQQFWVVFFLFFMTGIAIVIYLNQTPRQPRERDYAYAGSFYAFAMWCGLGVAALHDWLMRGLQKKIGERKAEILAAGLVCVPALAVPLQMVSQTWDDHDRSDRYMCRDFGLNYLETIPHDGVIYTNGDNDTFPLWYNEDTEGKRTDVRVCNLSYLQTDWYIDQMVRPAFDGEGQSSPLPISWTRYEYTSGSHERAAINPPVYKEMENAVYAKDYVQAICTEMPDVAQKLWGGKPFELKTVLDYFVRGHRDGNAQFDSNVQEILDRIPKDCIPSDTVYLTVDKAAVRRSGMKLASDSIPDQMAISLAGRGEVYKNFIMMLEMIAQSNFSRPLYMSTTVGMDNYGELYRNFLQEGMAWRITPFTYAQNRPQDTAVDTDRMYENMMNRYKYGNLSQRGLYIDETVMRMCHTHRKWFSKLISALVEEGKYDKALKALEKCDKEIPDYNVPHTVDSGSMQLASAYAACGQTQKAFDILEQLAKRSEEYSRWYLNLRDRRFKSASDNCDFEIRVIAAIGGSFNDISKLEKTKPAEAEKARKRSAELNKEAEDRYAAFVSRCDQLGISLDMGY